MRISVVLLGVWMGWPALAVSPVPVDKPSAYPAWWFEHEVVKRANSNNSVPLWRNHDYPAPDDFAVANVGQLKRIAAAAFDEWEAHLPGGAGASVTTLIKGWYELEAINGQPASPGNPASAFHLDGNGRRIPKGGPQTDDFAAVNLGQVKAVAKPFYDRLKQMAYTDAYPWTGAGADDYAVCNLGQLKKVFSFDPAGDGDLDGIANWWEVRYGLNPNDDGDAAAISQGGGLTNLEKYQADLNPLLADTDGDLVDDVYELQHGLDPRDATDATRKSPGTPLSNLEIFQGYTWQDFAVPLGRAGHNLYLLMPDGDGGSYSRNFRSIRPSPMTMKSDGNWQLQAASHLIAQVVYLPSEPLWQSVLVDGTVNESTPTLAGDYRNATWMAALSGLSSNVALPIDRRQHSFAMVGADGRTYPLTTGQEQGETTWDEATSTSTFHSFGFYTGTANVDSGYVVDLTTMEQGALNARELVVGGWSPLNLPSIMRSAYIQVAAAEAGHAFTLHTSNGLSQGVIPQWIQRTGAPTPVLYLIAEIGVGETFWFTRNSDQVESRREKMFLSEITADWSSDFGPVNLPQVFRLSLSRLGHGFLWHCAGTTRTPSAVQVVGIGGVDGNERFLLTPDCYVEVTFSVPSSGSGRFWISDETSGELSQADTLDLRATPWATEEPYVPDGSVAESRIKHLILPMARNAHAFSYMLDEGIEFPVTLNGERAAYGINPGSGQMEYRNCGFVSGTAYPTDGASAFHVIDLTASEQGPANTILLLESAWSPLHLPNASRPVQIAVSNSDDGSAFTFHTSSATLRGVTAGAVHFPSANYTGVGFHTSAAIGDTFWLTRDSDGAQTPHLVMGVHKQFVDWRSVFPPKRNLQAMRFQIGANRHGHTFKVQQPDGHEAPLLLVSNNNKFTTWRNSGGAVDYFYDVYGAKIDAAQPWTLVDVTTNEDLGSKVSVLDGWSVWTVPAESGKIAVNINEHRHGHQLVLRQADGTENPIVPAEGYEEPDYFVQLWNTWDVGGSSPVYVGICYFPAQASYDPAQSFSVVDLTTGEEQHFPAGTSVVELSLWAGAPAPVDLDMFVGRWAHELVLIQADGSTFPVVRGNLQGEWFSNPQRHFNTFNYFDATTQARPGVDWWIYDVTTGEVGGVNAGDLTTWIDANTFDDADDDELYDWFEFILGTNKNSKDSDGDVISDLWEARYGLDPNDSSDAMRLAKAGDMSNREKYERGLDPNSTDFDADEIPDAWEIAHGLDPKDPADAFQIAAGQDVLTNLQVYRGYEVLQLKVGLGRTSHSLTFGYTDQSGNLLSIVPETGSVRPTPLDGAGKVTSASYLGAIVVYRPADIAAGTAAILDGTTGESSAITIVGGVADGRSATWIPSGADIPRRHFALPLDRYEHDFVVVRPDGLTSTVTAADEQGEDVYDTGLGYSVFRSYGFFTAIAYAGSAAGDYLLVDVTSMEQGPANATEMVFGPWSPLSLSTIFRTVSIKVADHDAGYKFTLHTSGSTLQGAYPELKTVMDPDTWEAVTGYFITGPVAMGETFWLTRDVGGAFSPTKRIGVADLLIDWSNEFPRIRNLQTLSFRIGGPRATHQFIVRHEEAGFESSLQNPTLGQLITWNNDGQQVTYDYSTYQATVDTNQNWRLFDVTAQKDLGPVRDVLEGWMAWHPEAPEGFAAINLPYGRRGHSIQLRQGDGEIWNVQPAAGFEDPTKCLKATHHYFVGKSDQRTTDILYFPAIAPFDPVQGYTIVDTTTGEEWVLPAGTLEAELMQWFSAPEPLLLDISVVRWTHELVLHQANGACFPITQGNLQGTWSPDSQNRPWFTTYNFFDGTTQAHPDLEWWVYDATTGESSPPNTTDLSNWSGDRVSTDSDFDGLPDWYEFILGTLPDDEDTDNDEIPDAWEVRNKLDPRDTSDAALPSGQGNLTNLERYQLSISPVLTDSDGDGTPDAAEIAAGRNPFVPDEPRVKLKVLWFVAP